MQREYRNNNNVNISSNHGSSNTYFGDGFELTYDSNWEFEKDDAAGVLLNEELYCSLVVNKSHKLKPAKFDTEEDKNLVYESLHEMFTSDMKELSMKVAPPNEGFKLLKDNIYYATIDYGESINGFNGKLFIIVSKEDNVVLTFTSNSSIENYTSSSTKILDILKTIKF